MALSSLQFDVAFSFAGGHRQRVRAIAGAVAAQLGRRRVFLDEWHQADLLGPHMGKKLRRVYHDQSLMVIAILSPQYQDSDWCREERQAIEELRASMNTQEDDTVRLRFLDVIFDQDFKVENPRADGYLAAADLSDAECAGVIVKRFELLIQRRVGRDVPSGEPVVAEPGKFERPPIIPPPADERSASRFRRTWHERLFEKLGGVGDRLLILMGRRPSLMGRMVSGNDPEMDGLFALHAESWRAALLERLVKVDKSLQWEPDRYVELEAEVEEHDEHGRTRAIRSFQSALCRHRRRRVILVLGDPGSGKSVSLRNMARHLLDPAELRRGGRLAFYVNARDWQTPKTWVEGGALEPVDVAAHFQGWLSGQFAEQLDEAEGEMLKIFPRLLESGRIFVLVDSFDEIPAALDAHEQGRLLGIISAGVYQVLHGGARSQRRGILASRIYRRPVKMFGDPRRPGGGLREGFDSSCLLTMRPLSEGRLIKFLANHLQQRRDIARRLLQERPTLAAAARNPFTAILVVGFLRNRLEKGDDTLPTTREECYREALAARFLNVQADLAAGGVAVSIDDLEDGLKKLARAIFDGGGSFDIAAPGVGEAWPLLAGEPRLAESLGRHAILRTGPSLGTLGFSHRRLAEYLAALTLPDNLSQLPVEHVSSVNGRWRDALVVWCEVAPEDAAKALAEWCWEKIAGKGEGRDSGAGSEEEGAEALIDASLLSPKMAILRFLVEGYRGRPAALEGVREALGNELFWRLADRNTDLLSCKRLGECVCLLSQKDLSLVLSMLLLKGSRWVISETIRNCRFQEDFDDKTKDLFMDFLNSVALREMLASDGIMLSLSLSPSLNWARRELKVQLIDKLLLLSGIIISITSALFTRSGVFILLGAAAWLVIAMLMDTAPSLYIKQFKRNLTRFLIGAQTILFGIAGTFIFGKLRWVEFLIAALLLPIAPFVAERRFWARMRRLAGLLLMLLGYSFRSMLLFGVVGAIPLVVLYLSGVEVQASNVTDMWMIGVLVGACTLLWQFAKRAREHCLGRIEFSRLPEHFGSDLTRCQIADWLLKLRRTRFRLRLLRRIEGEGVLPKGRWREGRLPSFNDPKVDDRLAQLEEGWQEEEVRILHERAELAKRGW